MKKIVVNPYRYNYFDIGYQYDHYASEIIFDSIVGKDNYLKLEYENETYSSIPIPDNKFIVTSTYTEKAQTIVAQIMKKIDEQFIVNSPKFLLNIKPSVPYDEHIKETVPPNFKAAYDTMLETTKKYEEGIIQGGNTSGITNEELESLLK